MLLLKAYTNKSLVKLIKNIRPNDKCLNVGVSLNEDNQADFFIMNTHTLSTFSKQDAEQFEKEGNYSIDEVVKIKLSNSMSKYYRIVHFFYFCFCFC